MLGCMDPNRSLVRVLSSPTLCVAAICSLLAPAAGAEGALVNLRTLNGGGYSSASGVNATGWVVVGQADDGAAQGPYGPPRRAFRWTPASGMVSLGTLNGGFGSSSYAWGVNADGSVVVGSNFRPPDIA